MVCDELLEAHCLLLDRASLVVVLDFDYNGIWCGSSGFGTFRGLGLLRFGLFGFC